MPRPDAFTFDGTEVPFRPGQTVGAAMLAAGVRAVRRTRHGDRPRGLFCGIGTCFDCLAAVNGRPGVRTCLEPARPGDTVETQRGAGSPEMRRVLSQTSSGPTPGSHPPDHAAPIGAQEAEVVVVGAGPAGLAAAVAAADAGALVTVVDSGSAAGGQYLRQPAVDRPSVAWRHDPAAARVLRRAGARQRIGFLHGHEVWHVRPIDTGVIVHAVHGDAEREIRVRALVLATGAYELVLPFPGWDLPGVLTAGAAQSLLKAHDVLPGRRVLVAGTGPFLLAVAALLAGAGAQVATVVDAASLADWRRHPLAAARAPARLREAGYYLRQLRRHGVSLRQRSIVTGVRPGAALHATIAPVDHAWRPRSDPAMTVEVDAVCVGFGFVPSVELAGTVGCRLGVDARDGNAVVLTDPRQQTSVAGVFAAGEVTGIGGVTLALAEGAVAGLAAAHACGHLTASQLEQGVAEYRRQIRRERGFAAAMLDVHHIGDGWLAALADRTVLCRCEEITVGRVRQEMNRLGADDVRSLKLLTRAGMGLCQGRMCGWAASRMLNVDPTAFTVRPIAVPVPLSTLAGEGGSS